MSSRTLKSATISSLFWKLFEQGGNAIITLVVEIILARLLAPSEFGALAIMIVFVDIGTIIVQSGLNTAIIQAPDATERDYSTVFWMSLAISAILYAIVFCATPAIAAFYSMPHIVWPLRVLTLVLLINAHNSIQEAIVARELVFKKTFRATLAGSLVSGSIGIGLAVAGAGIWALVAQVLLMQVVRCIVLAIQVSWKPRFVFERARAAVLFRFGWKLLVSGLLNQLSSSLSSLIIGRMFTSAELGYVAQGKKYPQALAVILDGAIQPVMLSATARIQHDKEKVKNLARRALKTSMFVVVPAMTLFGVAAYPIVVTFLGEKWIFCIPFLQMYCVICGLRPIHTTNLQVINGMGRSDVFLKLEVIKTAFSIGVLCFTAFVMQDIYAIVGGYIFSGLCCTLINAYPNKRIIGYSYFEQLRDITPALLLALGAGIVTWCVSFLALSPLSMMLLQIVVMLVVYLGAARIFNVEAFTYLVQTMREMM